MSVSYDFSGKVALVTGATGAIGGAVYAALRAAGCAHVAHPSRMDLDVTQVFDVHTYLEQLKTEFGRLDILVACHAASLGVLLGDILHIDLWATANLCQAALRFGGVMRGQRPGGQGRVVLFSSIRAHWPLPGQAAYAAAKAGIEGLTRALAVAYGAYGITVNCVAPGAVYSPRTTKSIAAGVVSEAELMARMPAGRLTMPEDVANAVLWLCSEEAAMVNGQIITLDGGWSVQG